MYQDQSLGSIYISALPTKLTEESTISLMHGAWQCISIFVSHSGDIITAGDEKGHFTAGLMACIGI